VCVGSASCLVGCVSPSSQNKSEIKKNKKKTPRKPKKKGRRGGDREWWTQELRVGPTGQGRLSLSQFGGLSVTIGASVCKVGEFFAFFVVMGVPGLFLVALRVFCPLQL
jgi:hypothetical protein